MYAPSNAPTEAAPKPTAKAALAGVKAALKRITAVAKAKTAPVTTPITGGKSLNIVYAIVNPAIPTAKVPITAFNDKFNP